MSEGAGAGGHAEIPTGHSAVIQGLGLIYQGLMTLPLDLPPSLLLHPLTQTSHPLRLRKLAASVQSPAPVMLPLR